MKIATIRFLFLLGIIGTAVFMSGCASDFGKACTKFFEP